MRRRSAREEKERAPGAARKESAPFHARLSVTGRTRRARKPLRRRRRTLRDRRRPSDRDARAALRGGRQREGGRRWAEVGELSFSLSPRLSRRVFSSLRWCQSRERRVRAESGRTWYVVLSRISSLLPKCERRKRAESGRTWYVVLSRISSLLPKPQKMGAGGIRSDVVRRSIAPHRVHHAPPPPSHVPWRHTCIMHHAPPPS